MKTSILFTLSLFPFLFGSNLTYASCPPGYFDAGHDCIPPFAENPTIRSRNDGLWSNPNTWTPARVPGDGDVVRIDGHTIRYDTYNDAAAISVIGIGRNGSLKFMPDRDTLLKVGTLLVEPGGAMEIGTETNPIQPDVIAEVRFADLPIPDAYPGGQYGAGLLVLDGRFIVHGARKTPFVRLSEEVLQNQNTISLGESISGWRTGDILVVPGTNQRRGDNAVLPPMDEAEYPEIRGIAGNVISLDRNLRFNHPGARDVAGNMRVLPHVANVTRNVIFQSENPLGTRGHIQCFRRAKVDINGAWFSNLGRTTIAPVHDRDNHIGRYMLHMHHVLGQDPFPGGHQYRIVDCSFTQWPDVSKWAITIHGSHYGLIKDNVVVNVPGAGIVTEDGSESYNVFEHNFVAVCPGNGNRAQENLSGGMEGGEGSGLWFRGPNNYVRDNVIANCRKYSITYTMQFRYGTMLLPSQPGVPPDTPVDIVGLPILEFARNESFASNSDLTIWWLGNRTGELANPGTMRESVVKDFTCAHSQFYCFFGYETHRLTFDGVLALSNPTVAEQGLNEAFYFGDYSTVGLTIKNSDIQGWNYGIEMPEFANGSPYSDSVTVVKDSFLRNRVNIAVGYQYSTNTCYPPPQKNVIKNVTFAPMPSGQSQDVYMLWTRFHRGTGCENIMTEVLTYLVARNGDTIDTDDNAELYFYEQRRGYVIPPTEPDFIAHDPRASGLTNVEHRQRFGTSVADKLYPYNQDRTISRVSGLTAPLPSDLPPYISSHPRDRNATTSAPVTFSVEVVGSGLSYQWKRNGVDIDNANEATYTIPSAQASDQGDYQCFVWNSHGQTTSFPGRLTVNTTDDLPPTVGITSPQEGDTVSGTITVSADAADDSGTVARVVFYYNQTEIGTDTAEPFQVQWNTRLVSDGDYVLTAQAFDPSGNGGASLPVNVTVDNDVTPPNVSITEPRNNDIVRGTVTVSATATDDRGVVTHVDFYRGTTQIGSDDTAPYSIFWDTLGESDGSYELRAKAFDRAGNQGDSPTVQVTVANPPTVPQDLTAAAGDTLVNLRWSANTESDLAGYRLYRSLTLNGTYTRIGPNPINATNYSDTNVTNGQTYFYKVSAVDQAGNESPLSAPVSATPQGSSPPVLSNIRAEDITGNTANIKWDTDIPANSQVEYSRNQDMSNAQSVTRADFVTTHSVPLTGLQDATRYYYRVRSTSQQGGATSPWSDIFFFTTLDTTPPTAALTSPGQNALVRGDLPVTGTHADNVGVTRIEIYWYGDTIAAAVVNNPANPFQAGPIDTTIKQEGDHALFAVAYDAAGNPGVSEAVAVTIDNTDPSVAITSPQNDDEVSGIITISADASDDRTGINRVEFYHGTTLIRAVTQAPYSVQWNTAQRQNGQVALVAKAFDGAGNDLEHSIRVFVNNITPSIGITQPQDNAWVRGTEVLWEAATSGTPASDQVKFFLDGVEAAAVPGSSPYSYTWDSTQTEDGLKRLTARSYERTTELAVSGEIRLRVDNTAPRAQITSPANNSYVEGEVTITAAASDPAPGSGIERVFFYDGETLIGEDAAAPYEIQWNTIGLPDGNHSLSAQAADAAGNLGVSENIDVTVDNNAPTVSISNPTNNSSVRGTVPIQATASDAVGVTHVDIYYGATRIGRDSEAPYEVSWNTTLLPDGPQDLTAEAFDAIGHKGISSNVRVTVANPPATPQGLTAVAGDGQVNASWSRNTEPDLAGYRLYRSQTAGGTYTRIGPNPITDTNYADTNVTNNQTYFYKVSAVDQAGNESPQSNAVSATPRANPPPVLSNIRAEDITGNAANIKWDTDIPANSQVEYSRNEDLSNSQTVTRAAYVIDHSVPLTGLQDATRYYYRVLSTSQQGGATSPWSDVFFFTTLDTTPPTVSIKRPQNGDVVSGTVPVEAEAADNVGVAKVDFFVDGQLKFTDTAAPYHYQWNTASVPNGDHRLKAKAYDAAGNSRESSVIDVKVRNEIVVALVKPLDNSTVKGSVEIHAQASATLGILKVEFYVNQTKKIGTAERSPYIMTWNTLEFANGRHSLSAKAFDNEGREALSAAIHVIVDNDRTPPQILNVHASDITPGSAVIRWQTDEPARSHVEYGLSDAYGSQTPLTPDLLTSHQAKLENLHPGRTYYYRVKAIDGSGNANMSAKGTFTTPDLGSQNPDDPREKEIAIVPNPWTPGKQQGPVSITVKEIGQESEAAIYTLRGELVRRLRSTTAGSYQWDGRDDQGTDVAAGTYLFRPLNAGNLEKIVIIR